MAGETVIIAAIAEIVKLLIMAQNTAIKAGMTQEEFRKVAESINSGFENRKPEALPER